MKRLRRDRAKRDDAIARISRSLGICIASKLLGKHFVNAVEAPFKISFLLLHLEKLHETT